MLEESIEPPRLARELRIVEEDSSGAPEEVITLGLLAKPREETAVIHNKHLSAGEETPAHPNTVLYRSGL